MAEWTRKPNNTTVIRVNQRPGEPGAYLGRGPHSGYRPGDDEDDEPLYDPVAVSRGGYETHYFEADGDVEARRSEMMDSNGGCSPLYDPVAGGYREPKASSELATPSSFHLPTSIFKVLLLFHCHQR